MGNLVFQATLGGQVNLVGPNTASTYNLNVPAVSSTLATTTGTETLTNKTLTSATLTNPTINGFTGDTSVVNIGSGQFYKDTSGNVGIGTSSPNSGFSLTTQTPIYVNNQATDITPSAGGWSGQVTVKGSGYSGGLSMDSTGLWVGHNSGSRAVVFATNTTERARIDSSGNVGIGTSSPSYLLDLNTANANQLRLTSSSTSGSKMTFVSTSTNGRTWGIGSNFSTGNGEFAFYDYTANAERARFDSSGNWMMNSGYGSVATAYGCRAWVNFNGTGTVAIRASGNVSSITDNGTGSYTAVFSTAMPDTNYALSGFTATTSGSATNSVCGGSGYSLSTGSCAFFTRSTSSAVDYETVCVSFHR